ncbi:Acetyltransferase (GNAT) family [Seminavis robusta]|uniref:Acetyltransferase (GNAT) family n=1 Tax=Seminavis robusta TaxID=568900 RepID=A0A9N8EUZ7_9STRA|nr:Acetyltransferase (GNAT) family [Seminavis robusta]|eukprot:Sro2035_g312030.1 Acetyltransferase (GNAT) family (394) ;mRNA; r:1234-2415
MRMKRGVTPACWVLVCWAVFLLISVPCDAFVLPSGVKIPSSKWQSSDPIIGPFRISSFAGERATSHPTTTCQLFFKETTEGLGLAQRGRQRRRGSQAIIPSWVLDALRGRDVTLPFQFALSRNDDDLDRSLVSVRLLTFEDLSIIVPMCITEFGGNMGEGSVDYLLGNAPWDKPSQLSQFLREWFENATLPAYIYWTFWFKIVARNPQDHSLLVATLQQQQSLSESTYNNNSIQNKELSLVDTIISTSTDEKETIVGMVELSKQPPDPHRNPSAYPLPLWYKQAYCLVHNLPPINGWITNLLVDPAFRSQGYSKLLMAAAEGTARSWGCTKIHLHCDADTVAGKVPQRLYQNLGYEMVEDPNAPFAWMGTELSNKIYMIQGVALLYMRKELDG